MTQPLSSIARALGGEVVGSQVLCPGPGHSKKDRSLSVWLSATAPDGFVVHSHCDDDWRQCRDHVRALCSWDRQPWHGNRPQPSYPARRLATAPDPDEATKIARAVELWDAARDPHGSLVERHLASRAINLPSEVAGRAIRFHDRCPWRDEATDRTEYVPAMIAAMRSIATEEITGAHITRLTSEGEKVGRRMRGRASGAAIMLTQFSAVGAGLAIGEGIETSLSAWEMGHTSVWAMGSVGAIRTFPLIAGIQTLTLLGETDDGGASARAIEAVGARYAAAGIEVLVVEPRGKGDLNDVLRGAA